MQRIVKLIVNVKGKGVKYAETIAKLLTLSAFTFIGWIIWNKFSELSFEFLSPSFVIFFFLGIMAITGITLLHALSWYFMLRSFLESNNLPFSLIINSHIGSQIYKYLPGNVVHIAYRHVILKNDQVSNKKLAMAAVLENGTLLLCAILISTLAFLLTPDEINLASFATLGQSHLSILAEALIISFIIICLLFLISKFNISIASILLLSLYFIFLGCTFHLLATNFFDISIFSSIFVITISWLIGYLTLGSPGGMGTREVALMILLSDYANQEDLLALALCFRLVTIFGDVGSWLISSKLRIS